MKKKKKKQLEKQGNNESTSEKENRERISKQLRALLDQESKNQQQPKNEEKQQSVTKQKENHSNTEKTVSQKPVGELKQRLVNAKGSLLVPKTKKKLKKKGKKKGKKLHFTKKVPEGLPPIEPVQQESHSLSVPPMGLPPVNQQQQVETPKLIQDELQDKVRALSLPDPSQPEQQQQVQGQVQQKQVSKRKTTSNNNSPKTIQTTVASEQENNSHENQEQSDIEMKTHEKVSKIEERQEKAELDNSNQDEKDKTKINSSGLSDDIQKLTMEETTSTKQESSPERSTSVSTQGISITREQACAKMLEYCQVNPRKIVQLIATVVPFNEVNHMLRELISEQLISSDKNALWKQYYAFNMLIHQAKKRKNGLDPLTWPIKNETTTFLQELVKGYDTTNSTVSNEELTSDQKENLKLKQHLMVEQPQGEDLQNGLQWVESVKEKTTIEKGEKTDDKYLQNVKANITMKAYGFDKPTAEKYKWSWIIETGTIDLELKQKEKNEYTQCMEELRDYVDKEVMDTFLYARNAGFNGLTDYIYGNKFTFTEYQFLLRLQEERLNFDPKYHLIINPDGEYIRQNHWELVEESFSMGIFRKLTEYKKNPNVVRDTWCKEALDQLEKFTFDQINPNLRPQKDNIEIPQEDQMEIEQEAQVQINVDDRVPISATQQQRTEDPQSAKVIKKSKSRENSEDEAREPIQFQFSNPIAGIDDQAEIGEPQFPDSNERPQLKEQHDDERQQYQYKSMKRRRIDTNDEEDSDEEDEEDEQQDIDIDNQQENENDNTTKSKLGFAHYIQDTNNHISITDSVAIGETFGEENNEVLSFEQTAFAACIKDGTSKEKEKENKPQTTFEMRYQEHFLKIQRRKFEQAMEYDGTSKYQRENQDRYDKFITTVREGTYFRAIKQWKNHKSLVGLAPQYQEYLCEVESREIFSKKVRERIFTQDMPMINDIIIGLDAPEKTIELALQNIRQGVFGNDQLT